MKKPFSFTVPPFSLLTQFGTLYFLLAVAVIHLPPQLGHFATLWFTGAWGIAYLITQPRSFTLCLLACAALANFLAHLACGDSIWLSAAFAPANLAEMGIAAFLVRRTQADSKYNESPQNLLRFVLFACCVPPLLGATVGAATLSFYGFAPFSRVWQSWYAGATIGSVSLLPILLPVLRSGCRPLFARIDWKRTAWFALLSLSLSIFALICLPFPFIYIMAPLIVAAVSLSFESTAILVLLTAIAIGACISTGYFVLPVATSHWNVWSIYLPFLLTMIPPLAMAASANQGRLREQVRKQFEEALAQSHRELQTIIDHTPAMIGYWDSELKNRFGNRAYLEWFGLTAEKMRGMHIRDVIGEEKYLLNLPYMEAAFRGETSLFEREIVDQSGAIRTFSASYVPDTSEEKIKGYYAFVTDITSLKQAQREQLEAQAQLQGIIDSASEFAIIATGMDGLILVFSAGAERMLGYQANEVVGKLTPSIVHVPEEVEARGAELSVELGKPITGFDVFIEHARQGHAEVREWTYVRKDGSCLPVTLVVTAIHDIDGKINGFLGIAKNITQQKELQSSLVTAKEQAEAASRAKSEFVANMSHEIRTPLNAVLGMAYLLGNTPLSSGQKKYLDMIRVSGQSLLNILNDILDFSKIEAGRMELSPEIFDIGDVLNALANIMMVNAGEKDLELAIGIEPGVPKRLIGDALRLQQVLVNLTGNAIKFTEHGEIAVLVELAQAPATMPPDTVLLQFCIRDTGIGMDAEQQTRLFSAFAQADSSTTRRFGGTGLGLVICKRLVELMGGSIDLRSGLGEGSEFRVTLPLKTPAADIKTGMDTRLGNLHLLVIDDNQTSREYLCKTIQAWNWQVDSAASGAQGIERLRGQYAKGKRYDMVLIDWQMPGMDGLVTMQALRAELPESATPAVIMVSAFGRGKLIREKASSQADAILIKPVTGSALFDTLHETLVMRSGDARKSPFDLRAFPGHHRIDGAHLLLVEDNPLNQIVAKGMLEQAGATVDVAENGLLAINLLRNPARPYDVVLMDVQMPVLDGFAATRIIRSELNLTLPILAMTAGVMLSEREQCTASGMNDFIAKPIDVEQMFATIVRHLPAHSGRPRTIQVNLALPVPDNKPDTAFDPEQLLMIAEGNPTYRSQLLELIQSMVQRSHGQIIDARLAWKEGRIDEAARVFHTLRSPLGMLGAKQFVAVSLDIENAILTTQSERIAALFDLAEHHLNMTIAAARHWLEQQTTRYGSDIKPDAETRRLERAQIAHLRELLSEQNLEACDVYTDIRDMLHEYLPTDAISAIDVAMDSLMFDEVLRQLQPISE